MSLTTSRLRLATLAVVPLLVLSACGGSDDTGSASEDTASAEPSESAEPTEEPSEEPTEEAGDDAAAAPSGDTPAWAYPTTMPGTELTTFEAGQLSIAVYQVGTTPATEEGNLVDEETNMPILAEGDPLVIVNYVITNNGEDIDLGASLVDISAKYDDYPYLGGMDGLTDEAFFEGQGVNESGIMPGTLVEPQVYTLGAGQTYSYGDNFEYQQGSPITFTVDATPVDAEAELLFDEGIEGEGTATIS